MTSGISGNGQHPQTIDEIAEQKAAFPGATVKLSTLVMRDGQIAEAIDKSNTQHQGVINSYINAVTNDKDYRQILKMAHWKDEKQATLAVRAINHCLRTGAMQTLRAILDDITARSAGNNSFLMHEAFEALTHTTFTSQHYDYGKKKSGGNNSNSPIGK